MKKQLTQIGCIGALALCATPFVARGPVVADTSIIIAVYALVALSAGVIYGLAGLLSVAQASFAALGAYASAILCTAAGWSPWASLGAAVTIPAALAYPFARVVTRLSPLALAIAKLMFGYIFDIALREAGPLTGGYIGLSGIPPIPGINTPAHFHLLAWGCVLLAMAVYATLRESHFGSALRTIRSDALRAASDGVDVAHLRSVAMCIGGAMAGLAGWLYAHHLSYVGPESLSPALSLSALLMAVVGGARTLAGPVLGATILTVLFQVVPGQESLGIFYGGALIVCLLVAPEGILGALGKVSMRRLIQRGPTAAQASRDQGFSQRAAKNAVSAEISQ